MIRKLLNTSVFRLSLIYALLFSTVAAGALGFIYWMAKGQMEQQTDARLQLETDALLAMYSDLPVDRFTTIISMRNSENGSRYLFARLIHRSQHDFARDVNFKPVNNNPTQGVATLPFSDIITGKNRSDEPARLMLTILSGGYQLLVITDLQEQHILMDRLLQTVLVAIGVIFTLALLGATRA